MTKWTDWGRNPFALILEAGKPYYDPKVLEARLREVVDGLPLWVQVTPEDFLDDLMEEIAGATNIVAQYNPDTKCWRAAWDGEPG